MALLGQPIDERTAALALPLPHIGNYQEDDVPRLRAALELIDTAMQLMGMGAKVTKVLGLKDRLTGAGGRSSKASAADEPH